MPKEREIELRFYKINYQHNFSYYKDNSPKEVFHSYLFGFFNSQSKNHKKILFKGREYQICGLKTDNKNYIFGKIWKLKTKKDKDYPWNEEKEDYEVQPKLMKDFNFNYFYISLDTHHIVIQYQTRYISDTVIEVLTSWYDNYYGIKDGMIFQSLKDKNDFILQIKKAYKIVYAKFVVYPSNHDWDFLGRPLDEEMKRKKISKLTEEMESKDGLEIDSDKSDMVNAPLAQSLRGNGEPPIIKTQDKQGNITILSHKIKNIRKLVPEVKNMLMSLKQQLDNVLLEYDEENKS